MLVPEQQRKVAIVEAAKQLQPAAVNILQITAPVVQTADLENFDARMSI